MIDANEAKKLYEESGFATDNWIKVFVEPEVIKAAKSGKREVFIYISSVETWRPVHTVVDTVDPVIRSAVTSLNKLKYIVNFVTYGGRYIPKGLMDEDGSGPEYINFGMRIVW